MSRKSTVLLSFLVALLLCACNSHGQSPNANKYASTSSPDNLIYPDVSATTIQETTAYGPPTDEYTEIVLHDDQFYLCKKVHSGFSENGEYYGIYDAVNRKWALEYAQYDTYDVQTLNFINHGCGVFSYKYSSYYGTRMFLSADLGYVFETDKVYNPDSVKFIDGRAIVLIHDEPSQTYVNGMIAPNSRLVWLDTNGTIQDIDIPGFDSDDLLYWSESVLTGDSDQDKIYADCFSNYNTGEGLYYIFVFHYEDGSTTIISDQEYTSRLQKYIGDSPSNSNITIEGELIRIDQIEGDDGNLYYSEFDKDGNLVTPATPMN